MELIADECMTLDVYAEQYGVRSENKTYTICYNSKSIYSLLLMFGLLHTIWDHSMITKTLNVKHIISKKLLSDAGVNMKNHIAFYNDNYFIFNLVVMLT